VPGSAALKFVLLVGAMSFFADFTYEGARSIVGPYLAMLGAGALAVGVVTGFGELLGYGLRLVSGRLSDKTGEFWPIMIAGYVLQMSVVPLLALAGSWQLAALLIVLERVGKATRNPPRDAMLAHAAGEMGYGWAAPSLSPSFSRSITAATGWRLRCWQSLPPSCSACSSRLACSIRGHRISRRTLRR